MNLPWDHSIIYIYKPVTGRQSLHMAISDSRKHTGDRYKLERMTAALCTSWPHSLEAGAKLFPRKKGVFIG